jgi:hypothetical protein
MPCNLLRTTIVTQGRYTLLVTHSRYKAVQETVGRTITDELDFETRAAAHDQLRPNLPPARAGEAAGEGPCDASLIRGARGNQDFPARLPIPSSGERA